MDVNMLNSLIMSKMDDARIPLDKEIIDPGFLLFDISYAHAVSYTEVIDRLKGLKKDAGLPSYVDRYLKCNERFCKFLKAEDFIRSCPPLELGFCNRATSVLNMLNTYKNGMLKGGNGLHIGTPTSHSICLNMYNYRDILVDNLYVTKVLQNTTDTMEVIIGNARNIHKAQTKVKLYNCFVSNANIIDAPVSANTFYNHVERIASNGKLTKVVFMTSGNWKGYTQDADGVSRYYEHLHFKLAANSLIDKFPKLIIIAMTGRHLKATVLVGKEYENKNLRGNIDYCLKYPD